MPVARCGLCPEVLEHPDAASMAPLMEAVAEHLRIMHPGRYADPSADGIAPMRWPDGGLVVDDSAVRTPDEIANWRIT